jgi:putative FmdB family regulatory protein
MPLYEYECDACGQRFELIQKYSDGPPEACPKCAKGPVQRLQSSPAFHLKGSGWYITDYARKGTSPEGESAKGESSKGEGSKGEGSKKADDGASASSSSGSGGDSKKADNAPAPAPPAPSKPPAS